jgi:UTP--glucose-1-phosphate uridylyltransferase
VLQLAVVPAAGLGSRFLPVSRVVPKELLPFGTRPLIHHALDEVERAGFERAAVVISPDKAAIRTYFEADPGLERRLEERGDQRGLGELREAAAIAARLQLRFVEQPLPLGLGEAVARCGRLAAGEPFAVLLPDDVIPTSDHWTRLRALHDEDGAHCLCVRPVPADQVHRFGIAACVRDARGHLRVERLVEKPRPDLAPSNLAVLGRYIVTQQVLYAIGHRLALRDRGGEVGLTESLADAPGLLAVPFAGEHFDCGTPEDYARSLAASISGRPPSPPTPPAAAASAPDRERSSPAAASPGSPRRP